MKRILLFLLALLLLPTAGCQAGGGDAGTVTVYGPSDAASGGALIAVELPGRPEEETVEYLLTLLTEGMEERGYESPLPRGTSVNSWTLTDGLLTVDFSPDYGQLSGLELVLADYCVVLTMTGLDGIDAVTITVGGHILAEHRAVALTAEDITLDGGVSDPVTLEIQLFFPLTSGEGIGTEYRVLTADSEAPSDQAAAVLEALCAGPSSDSMRNFLPADPQELTVTVEGGICAVELEEFWLEAMNADSQAMDALESTLTMLDAVDSVTLLLRTEE